MAKKKTVQDYDFRFRHVHIFNNITSHILVNTDSVSTELLTNRCMFINPRYTM